MLSLFFSLVCTGREFVFFFFCDQFVVEFDYFNLQPVNSFRLALLRVTSVLSCNFSILFQPNCKKAQNGLFSRIADSFVALFFSVSPDFKDRFFQV